MDAVISTKGQVVIPKRLRDQWGLTTGSRVKIESTAVGIQITPLATRNTRQVLKGSWDIGVQGKPHINRRHESARGAQGTALISSDTNPLVRSFLLRY